MKDPHDIVIGPIITERSVELSNKGIYVFRVAQSSCKIEIAKAIESIYQSNKVSVASVNTAKIKGKSKRYGMRKPGKKPDWKKAYVTLAKGQRIEDYTV